MSLLEWITLLMSTIALCISLYCCGYGNGYGKGVDDALRHIDESIKKVSENGKEDSKEE